MEFENFSSVKASSRRRMPVWIKASTWAFTFSIPASASTTGTVPEDAVARVASSSTVTLLTGANESATRQAKDASRAVVDHGVAIRSGPVTSADDGGVEVPHLVGSTRAQSPRWCRWLAPKPGASPAVRSDEALPGRRRRCDGVEPRREHRECAGREVTGFGSGDQIPDRVDLGARQLMRCRPRAGRLIVECTRRLPPTPGLKPTPGQRQEPQDLSQRDTLARAIPGAKTPQLGVSLRQTCA